MHDVAIVRSTDQSHEPRKMPTEIWRQTVDRATIICCVFFFAEAWIWPPDLHTIPGQGGEFQYLLKGLAYFLFLLQTTRYFFSIVQVNLATVLFSVQFVFMLIFLYNSPLLFYSLQYMISLLGISFGMIVVWRDNGLAFILRTSLNTFIAILFLSATLAILVPSIGVHSRPGFEGYWRGTFANKNGLGQAAFLAGLLLLMQWQSHRLPALIGKASIIALCVLLSRSSTSLTCLAAALAMYAVFGTMRRIRFGGQLSRVVTVLGGPVMVALVATFWLDILALLGRDETLSGRLLLWRLSLGLWESAPILGRGLAFFQSEPGMLAYIRAVTFAGFVDSHNAYVQAMLETGLVGLALFMLPFMILLLTWFIRPSRFTEVDSDLVFITTAQLALFSITESANGFYKGFGMVLVNLFLISSYYRR